MGNGATVLHIFNCPPPPVWQVCVLLTHLFSFFIMLILISDLQSVFIYRLTTRNIFAAWITIKLPWRDVTFVGIRCRDIRGRLKMREWKMRHGHNIYTSLFTNMVAHKKKIQTTNKRQYKKHINHTQCAFTEHYNIYKMYWPNFRIY